MNNQYIIPANSKKSSLLFGVFRPIDLGIFGVGATITLFLLFIIKGDTIGVLFLKLFPLLFSLLLVMPINYYHNVLVFIREFCSFYFNRRNYIWKGWCIKSGSTEK